MKKRTTLRDFQPDDQNANLGTPRGQAMIEESIRRFGAGRSILVDKNGRVIAGNKTQEAALDAGIEDVIVVETDGKQLVVVKRTDIDLDSPTGRQLAIADNRTGEVSLNWDTSLLAELQSEGIDLSLFWAEGELAELLTTAPNREDDSSLSFDDLPLTPVGVPDAVWPSDNEWGVPLLDIQRQADAFDAPIMPWGAKQSRSERHAGGTYHFYTDDYRFSALWTDPTPVINSGVVTIVEPNFSIYTDMPRYEALHQIGRKRWLARYWQSQGLRIVVDLNIAERYYDLALLGVPKGWAWYATRGYSDRIENTILEYELARQHADGATVNFMVYGGGKAVKELCQSRGWLWVMEQRDQAKVKIING